MRKSIKKTEIVIRGKYLLPTIWQLLVTIQFDYSQLQNWAQEKFLLLSKN